MLSFVQIKDFSKLFKTNESVVIREYLQTLFLKELYDEKYSQYIFFKGGTAIRLVFNGNRFSEDLDFTVTGSQSEFENFLESFFKKLNKLYNFSFKKRETIVGLKYLLIANLEMVDYKMFINLDFSFREEVLKPTKSVIVTEYPVVFTSFVNHLSAEEIVAEKIRAIMTREKGRDIYDLWFLLSKNIVIDKKMVEEKVKYYKINKFSVEQLINRIIRFNREQFILDLKPFVPINEREKLGEFFDYTIAFLKNRLEAVE